MLEAPKGKAIRTSETCDLNPLDRPAIEMALEMSNTLGGTVTALSMGPDSCAFALRDVMAMGADRGVLLSDPIFAGSDTLATSTILAAAIEKLSPFTLLFFGTRTSDSDTGQVGPQTAVALGLPLVTGVVSLETAENGFQAVRRNDGFEETYLIEPPAGLTVHSASIQPRDAGLGDIGAAYETRDIEKWRLADLDVSPDLVGEAGSPTRVASLKRKKIERKCELIDGEPDEQAETLMQKLLKSGLIG